VATKTSGTRPSVRRFLAWVLVGLLLSFALLSLLTIGVFVLPLAVLGWWLVARRGGMNAATAGTLSGLGLAPLYVAWLNRDGPGNICHHITNGESCTQESAPLPWLLAGLLLLFSGLVAYVVLRRWRSDRPAAEQFSWALAAGTIICGAPGAVLGLVVGLVAYPQTAAFAVIEAGFPTGFVGGLLGAAVGGLRLLFRRAEKR
jgi:hypothetical protein